MILVRAQLGNTIVDFITEGNKRKVNQIINGDIARNNAVSIYAGNRLYDHCVLSGYQIATYVDGVKISRNPIRAFAEGTYYNHG